MNYEDEVILNVESGRYLLTMDEAMSVARILGAAVTIGTEWRSGQSDFVVYRKPNAMAAAILPFHANLRMEVESNMREKDKKP
jgi:hypothetical protein